MRRLIYTAAAALACLSCIHEFPEPDILPEQGDEEKTRVTFRVSNAFRTRSSVDVDDEAVNDINIYAYRDGLLETTAYFETPGVVVMELTKGAVYNLYAVANVGQKSGSVKEPNMANYPCAVSSVSALKGGIPMSWKKEGIRIAGRSQDISITLERLAARIGFSVDASLLSGLQVNSVKVMQMAKTVRPFQAGGSKAANISEVTAGDVATSADLSIINRGGTAYFLAMENVQGNLLPDNKDPWKKIPSSIGTASMACTYLEVECSFLEGSLYSGTVKYRFYPGDDNTSDFSIRRNTDMRIVMCPTGPGLKEISWKVTSNVSIRDGFAWGYIDEGRHRADDMYLGELFCYYVEIGEELSDHFGGDISGCSLEFVSADGGSISFEDYDISSEWRCMYATGTCRGAGTGEVWLRGPDGERVTPVGGGFRIQKPKIVLSYSSYVDAEETDFSIDEQPWCVINEGKERLHVYFTDSDGYNLNTDYWTGYDLSVFSFDRDPYIESRFGIESTLDAEVIMGTANSNGPVAIYDITCRNDGTNEDLNLALCDALAARDAFYIDIDESNHGIGTSVDLYLDFQAITLTLVDNGWAKYGNTQLALKVDNPSNLPLTIRGWQVNRTNTDWNAIYRNEIIDDVENGMILSDINYITSSYYSSQLPLHVQSFVIYSERNGGGDRYIADGNLMVYNIYGVQTDDIVMTTSYMKSGQEALHHLIDVQMPGTRLTRNKLTLVDNLEDGSLTYSIIYGDDPDNPGYNNQGMWLYSQGTLISKANTTLDTYTNVTAMNLSNLFSRYDSKGAYGLTITYDSSAGQLYAKCTKGNLFGIKMDVNITGTVQGYVKTYPNGTWGSGKDNNCSATISKTVTGVTVTSSNTSIDGGAIKSGMDAIYAQTFYDSKNAIGSSNNYQHAAHPTSMDIKLQIRLNSASGTELYPITLTWNDTKLSYYHSQDGTTYTPTITKTMPLFNMIRVEEK